MRVVVAYESMYGFIRRIAEAIADGFATNGDVAVVPVSQLEREPLNVTELLVVGGPTHVHGMSRVNTRKAAVEAARKQGAALAVESNADVPADCGSGLPRSANRMSKPWRSIRG
jgi:flavorubredoxin